MMVKGRTKQRTGKFRKGKRKKATKTSKLSNAIQVLRRMTPSQRCSAIRNANDAFIQDIVSCVRRLRTKKLPPKFKKLIKRYAAKLRVINSTKVNLQRKRKVLSQKGGFIGPLLPMLASVVIPFVRNILK